MYSAQKNPTDSAGLFIFGTSGRTDDISLGAVITCYASAFGAHIASAIGRTEDVGSRRPAVMEGDKQCTLHKKTPPIRQGFLSLVPVVGLEPTRF